MGRQSRKRKIRKAIRPLMEAAVTASRMELRNNPRSWKILPDDPGAASQLNHPPEQKQVCSPPLLIIPTASETIAVSRSRQ